MAALSSTSRRIIGAPALLVLAALLACAQHGAAFILPAASPLARGSGAAVAGEALTWGRRACSVAWAKKDDADDDLSAEFARRLEDDEDDAPAFPFPGRRRPPPPPQGAGTPQKAQQRFFTVPQTKSFNRDEGTDYWMDEKDVQREQKRKAAKRKPRNPDQFPAERIKSEIVSPYKNNWILFIAITIFSLAFFVYLFPEELQLPSLQIPDFETAAPIPEQLK